MVKIEASYTLPTPYAIENHRERFHLHAPTALPLRKDVEWDWKLLRTSGKLKIKLSLILVKYHGMTVYKGVEI
jgi:hypothetical protein